MDLMFVSPKLIMIYIVWYFDTSMPHVLASGTKYKCTDLPCARNLTTVLVRWKAVAVDAREL